MSDDTKSKGGWQPPEPVFRSTEGKTPRTAPGYVDPDDIDTQAPDFMEADTDEWETDPAPMTASPSGDPKPRPAAAPPAASGGCFSTFLTMLSMLTLFGLLLVAIAAYFLLYYTPRSTTF